MADAMNPPAGHGGMQRGLQEAAQATGPGRIDRHRFDGRFNRLFPDLPAAVYSLNDLDSLAAAMSAGDDADTPETTLPPDAEENVGTPEDPGIPAGYTYFGQFVDHDITLDPVTLTMQQEDVSAVENFRTPALDLDCLYARGPDDQPYLYDPTGRLFVLGDRDLTQGASGPALTKDLPRLYGRAVIGDKRNDENVIVSQLHGLFLRYHNRLATQEMAQASFDDVRQRVRWTYQWLVLRDYLPRIVGPALMDQILPVGSWRPVLMFFQPAGTAFIPVEFTGAAYRYGHSMVRPLYRTSAADIGGPAGDPGRRPVLAPVDQGSGLAGFHAFDAGLGIDWSLFFETDGRTLAGAIGEGPKRIQPAYKIDTSLVFPTTRLPEFSNDDGTPREDGNVPEVNVLAQRNLRRGMMLGLPSGQAVARRMNTPVLPDDALIVAKAESDAFDDAPGAPLPRIADGRPTMQGSAPLWFYVLAEARHAWRTEAARRLALPENAGKTGADRDAVIDSVPTRLGPVGGHIVAETLVGLVAADPRSVLNEGASRGFLPSFGTVGDFVAFMRGV